MREIDVQEVSESLVMIPHPLGIYSEKMRGGRKNNPTVGSGLTFWSIWYLPIHLGIKGFWENIILRVVVVI